VEWIDAGPLTDFAEVGAVPLALGRMLVVVAHCEGDYFAVEDRCTHDDAELAGGAIEGCEIICPRHGARFCLRTGSALTPPAYEPVRTFETKVASGRLWVRAG
jgi:3-phenylpropionate/trans-cinnamate dioxygenase ferredoxin subunit